MSSQPLGYLVKALDNALQRYVDRVLRNAHGVGRSHWQALRTAQDGDTSLERFTIEAGEFYGPAQIDELLTSLTGNGWLRLVPADDGTDMQLTDSGRELLEQMGQTQARTMQIAADGVSQEDYAATLRTLDRIVENLEAASARIESGSVEGETAVREAASSG
ncbi:hypothetical protein [Nocardia sp. CNY236]|uniref:hypothetical protein n=1 Tax=Nocardia sp. CNY236 TaxID=1169152 RepID=UPI000400D224|nr:hypothetical protein [Nocardia sp. CNY236]